MEDRISALMDGELDDGSAREAIDALGRNPGSLATWRIYHLIGDAMREGAVLSPGYAAPALRAEPRRRMALPLAASVAAVALVGWLAFAPQREAPPSMASAVAPAQQAAAAHPPTPPTIPLPKATSDYLLAHQGFSPRVSFQGMAPYIRTVSDEAREARK